MTVTLGHQPVPIIVLLSLLLSSQARPDFSGTWRFDQEKSLKPGPDGRVVLAPMLGDEVVVLQTGSSVTFRITFQGDTVVAIYDLSGVASENVSPGDIKVTSRTSWEGDKLVIDSTSEAEEAGRPVTIRTTRVIWIDEAGDLVVERSGTPASQVTASRSVYRRVK